MRVRLRSAHSPARLAELYARPHSHDHWPDHRLRVSQTIALARSLGVPDVIADLSCGDNVIGLSLLSQPHQRLISGDLAPGYELCGPIEKTVRELPRVGMFICSETIEHLDDPDTVLQLIRETADKLVLSTPLGETSDRNSEHYWGWDAEGVRVMLRTAGWQPVMHCDVHYLSEPGSTWMPASYQVWGCK